MPDEGETHDRVVSLLKAQDEESLDCLSKLLPRFGRDLDTEEAKVTGREGGGDRSENSFIHENVVVFSSLASDGSIF